MSKMDCFSNKF